MQQARSQYGVPPSDMTPFTATAAAAAAAGARSQMLGGAPNSDHSPTSQAMAEAVPPINSRPPQPQQRPPPNTANLEELATTVSGNFHDNENFCAGEENERGAGGGVAGNRWPRDETLALIKIRSDMDVTFRDATLKGPLWDEVSRKLAQQGYTRSAKKCKEKFENVHKYYKRTKEGRAGRQDGKSYRFFPQLEALHNNSSGGGGGSGGGTPSNHQSSAASLGMSGTSRFQPTPLSSAAPLNVSIPQSVSEPLGVGGSAPAKGIAPASIGNSFSIESSSSDSSETEGEDTEGGLVGQKRKRKSTRCGNRKTMAFFKDLMKQLMDQQEAMQQKLLETMEKREQDRMIREEAWRRQEIARLSREHEALAQERAMSANRDTAIINFLQTITGQTIQLPQLAPVSASTAPPSPSPPPSLQAAAAVGTTQQATTQQKKQYNQQQITEVARPWPASPEMNIVVDDQQQGLGGPGGSGTEPTSSRWPKIEVHALIKLRSGMESRYQDAGPKGPLWDEISKGMKQMGYNRSAKRCKEKWENINKYFKRVKESNKKRPEDAKTCPYFHQLDALYRKKSLPVSGSGESLKQTNNEGRQSDVFPITTNQPRPQQDRRMDADGNDNGANGCNSNNNGGNAAGTSNGDLQTSFFEGNTKGRVAVQKPEDIMKKLIAEQQHTTGVDDYDKDSDNMDDDVEDEEDEEEEQKMAFKIEYQKPNVGGASNGGGAQSSATGVTTAATAGSFLAMVQ